DNMIIKPITETSPIRQLARMRKVNTLKAATVTRDILLTAYWTGEGENRTSSNSQYGKKEISVNSMTGKVEVTNEALLDSMFDIENEIMSDMNEYFAQAEGSAFVNGDGVKKPLGFMSTSAGLTRFNSGSAATFDFDALIKLAGQLKTGYNPIYGMNRQVAAFVRTLKDGNGQYVWQMGNMAAGVPNSINGYAYVELPDMSATIGANSENVIFADFSKMYEVVDAFQAIVTRNPYILQDEGKTVTYVQRFVGGGVLLKEAGVVLKCAV
ncbi:phage major capsid protein, partial [Fangia hongkongensis]